MNRLGEFTLDDSLSEKEEEGDDDFEVGVSVIFNDEVRQSRLGSEFNCVCINQDRAEGHAKVMRDYFNPNAMQRINDFGCPS
jgi:hypothetical protein